MSNSEAKELNERLNHGLALAEQRMLEEKALRGEDIIISHDGITIERIPAREVLEERAML